MTKRKSQKVNPKHCTVIRTMNPDESDSDLSQIDDDLLCEKIIKAANHLKKLKARAKCVKVSRKKSPTCSNCQPTSLDDDTNCVIENKCLLSRVERSKTVSEDSQINHKKVHEIEKFSYDEQCDMISFLIETNRISSCCSIYSWKVMAIKRSKRPPESLLKQFKSVIAPNISQFLYQLSIIELPGILKEFRSALSQAGIHENSSSAVLSESSSPSSIIRQHSQENRNPRTASPVPEIIPPKLSPNSSANNQKHCVNKVIESRKIRLKVERDSSARTRLKNPGTDENYEVTSSDNDLNIAEGESECVEIINSQRDSSANGENSNCSMDNEANVDHSENKTDNESHSSRGRSLINEESSAIASDTDEASESSDSENSQNLNIGRKTWEEMYGPIIEDYGRLRKRTFNDETNIIKQNLKSRKFSPKLLSALNQEREATNKHKSKWLIVEELAILHYFICRPMRIRHCLGPKAFLSIVKEKWRVLQNRTAAAMMKYFRHNILSCLDKYSLPDEIYNEFLYWEWHRWTAKDN